ncbi:MAG: hypothetical protein QM627_12615 [Luteolibacter sp.]
MLDLGPSGSFTSWGKAEVSKRGEITSFSDKSRRRLMRELHKMKVSSTAYTSALTMVRSEGDDVELLNEWIMAAFARLKRRFCNVSRFSKVSMFWKRECHKSGVIHYHLIIFGVENDALRTDFHGWLVRQWNGLLSPYLSEEKREEHRWWHARPENMEEVRGMAYFVKYVGVPEEAGALKGRWWGMLNAEALPVSPQSEAELDRKAAAMMNRIARKVRQKRANEAKHRAIAKACNLVDFKGNPLVSQFGFVAARSAFGRFKGRATTAPEVPWIAFEAAICIEVAKKHGKRWGKARMPRKGRVVLCGSTAPAIASRALAWVSGELGLNFPLHEKTNQPRQTPPRIHSSRDFRNVPYRSPGHNELCQSDFLGVFPSSPGHRKDRHPPDEYSSRSTRRIAGASVRSALPRWVGDSGR